LLPLLLGQLWYWGRYFRPFARRPAEAPATDAAATDAPVSVIVCAHNELDNLRELLPLLLRQDYPPGFEVLLVDDRSQDDTLQYAQQLGQLYGPSRFRLVSVKSTPAGFSPKKYALTLGIRAARHERLLFTDADCRPVGSDWVRLMQRGFNISPTGHPQGWLAARKTPSPSPFPDGEGELATSSRASSRLELETRTSPPSPSGKGLGDGVLRAASQHLTTLGPGRGTGADLVLGFSNYAAAPGLLNALVRYETLLTAAQYLSFAWAGHPYMGVGRNLAYTAAIFHRVKGFASHVRALSGDDDLLVRDAVAAGARVAVVADAPAHTLSRPPETWRAWMRQKTRHLSAGPAYRPADRRRLARFMGANLLWYALTPLVLAADGSAQNLVTLALLWLGRSVLLLAAYRPLARRLGIRLPALALPALDFLYFSFYCGWGLAVLLRRRPPVWK